MFICPDAQKVGYKSTMLAGNAVILHEIQTACGASHYYPCEGSQPRHWRIGHKKQAPGEQCKAEPRSTHLQQPGN